MNWHGASAARCVWTRRTRYRCALEALCNQAWWISVIHHFTSARQLTQLKQLPLPSQIKTCSALGRQLQNNNYDAELMRETLHLEESNFMSWTGLEQHEDRCISFKKVNCDSLLSLKDKDLLWQVKVSHLHAILSTVRKNMDWIEKFSHKNWIYCINVTEFAKFLMNKLNLRHIIYTQKLKEIILN